MDWTPLMHKPVIYGSAIANTSFITIAILHILGAVVIPLAVAGAIIGKKGGTLHMRCGVIFVVSMLLVVGTGIILDVVRLMFFVEQNHTKYNGFSMPSSYPARLAFLYAALCIIHLMVLGLSVRKFKWLKEINGLKKYSQATGKGLVFVGVALTIVIFLKFNPWTGALWIVWTFAVIIAIALLIEVKVKAGLFAPAMMHGFCMLSLIAFAGWGTIQGFIPAMSVIRDGVVETGQVYTGNLPGEYNRNFFGFLRWFAPPFIGGAILFVYFSVLPRRDFSARKKKE